MAYLGNTLINGSLRCLNKAYFNDLSIGNDVEIAGKTTTNQLIISSDYNSSNLASANSSTTAIPLVIGNPTGVHIAMDVDEIQFKNNATSNRAGYINYGGGRIYLSNGTKIYADNGVFKADSLGTSDSRIPNAYITTLDATIGNITTLKTSTAHADNLTVYDTLKSSKWDISSVANLANDFMVAPTIKISSDGEVTISNLSTTDTTSKTCRLTFSDATQINSDEFAGCRWYAGSKVRVTFTINGTLNSNIEGTLAYNMNPTAGTLTIDVTLDDRTNLSNTTYEADDSTIMLYEIASGNNLYPVGIRMTAYGTNNSSYIDMYGGTASTDYTHPIVRIGRLNGITFNGKTFGTNALPAAWGIYTLNGYFEGAIVAKEGKIANFTIASDKLYTGTHSAYNTNANGIFIDDTYISFGKQALTYFKNDGTGKIGAWVIGSNALTNGTWGANNSAMVCTGSSTAKVIGGSESISGWTFTSGANFGVTKTGALYASDVNISGAVNATALHVGSSASANHLIYENSTIDLKTDWLRFDNNTNAVTIGKDNAPRVVIDGKSMQLKNYQDITYFNVEDLRNSNNVYHFTNEKVTCDSSGTRLTTNYTINTNYSFSITDSNGNIVPYDRLVNNTQIEGTFIQDEIYTINYTTSDSIYRISYGNNRRSYTGANSVNLSTTGKATGNVSYCEGHYSVASGDISHAEGYYTEATGNMSHAEGRYTNATGNMSHAEGGTTTASGNYSHAEGYLTEASGKYSHAEGYQTKALGERSHAEGRGGTASGNISHAEGYLTEASGDYSHAEGYYTKATGDYSHAEGYYAKASNTYSHGEGDQTVASGFSSHAEGGYAVASASYSHAEGNRTTASGTSSHAGGTSTYATKHSQTVIGKYNAVTTSGSGENIVYNAGNYSFIIGNGEDENNRSNALTIDWTGSVASGNDVTASGESSIATGCETVASGFYSHAEGLYSVASNTCSHASGEGTYATSANQTTIGKYNAVTIDSTFDPPLYDAGSDYAFIIGNGTSNSNRSNALTVEWNGRVRSIAQNVSTTTTPSSDTWIPHYNLVDSTGYGYGVVQGDFLANGETGITLQTQRIINNTYYQNHLGLHIKNDGTPVVTVGHPEKWRIALGINIKTYAATVTTDQYGQAGIPSAVSSKTIISVRANDYRYCCFIAGTTLRLFTISSTPVAWAKSVSVPLIFTYID